jgi:hypothetical protein
MGPVAVGVSSWPRALTEPGGAQFQVAPFRQAQGAAGGQSVLRARRVELDSTPFYMDGSLRAALDLRP